MNDFKFILKYYKNKKSFFDIVGKDLLLDEANFNVPLSEMVNDHVYNEFHGIVISNEMDGNNIISFYIPYGDPSHHTMTTVNLLNYDYVENENLHSFLQSDEFGGNENLKRIKELTQKNGYSFDRKHILKSNKWRKTLNQMFGWKDSLVFDHLNLYEISREEMKSKEGNEKGKKGRRKKGESN